jgi:hypothetical protein
VFIESNRAVAALQGDRTWPSLSEPLSQPPPSSRAGWDVPIRVDGQPYRRSYAYCGGFRVPAYTWPPCFIIIVIGMWMLAGEFLPLARFFDRLEVRLRKVGQWIKECWMTLPTSVKALVALVCAAALGYGIFCLVSGS